MEKCKEIEIAKKRRAKLLAEHKRTGWTHAKLGLKYGVTGARIGFMLRVARKEHE